MRLVAKAGHRRWWYVACVVGGLAFMLCAWSGPVLAQLAPVDTDGGAAREAIHYRVPVGGPFPIRKQLTIGVDKSMLIEVPVDLTNVLVSNPEVIDAVVQTSRQVYLLAKDLGEANAFFIGPDGMKVLFLEVKVQQNLNSLRTALNRLFPGSQINVEMVGENVVLSGRVAEPQDANRAAELAQRFAKKKDSVVNMITTSAKEQVLLKVKVAEVQRDALRRIGVDYPGVWANAKQVTFTQVISNAFPVTSPLVAASQALQVGELPQVAAGKALQTTWEKGNQNVTALLQMLERRGFIRTLAEPNLTAISGEKAKFLAGGEFPVPVSQEDNKVTVQYKEFGVNVSFKPVVLGAGRISLNVAAEVSEISTEGAVTINSISLPGLKVRRAETTLELPSGGTLAMAGLLSDDVRQSVEGVPGLKNLPVLGALFRSNDFRRRETELVILVTPYIATHAHKDELARPGSTYAPVSELKELFFGHINRIYGGPGLPEGQRYRGDFGYIVEYPYAGVKG
jgi:pilus assembly protein CpaC